MKVTEIIAKLEELKKEHGDIPILLADRYAHYDIKYMNFSNACYGDHVCIRMQDNIKYENN